MTQTGRYDDKWALRLAFDSASDAFNVVYSSNRGLEEYSYESVVGTTATRYPSVSAGGLRTFIVLFKPVPDNLSTQRLRVSVDGGTNFFTLSPGQAMEWDCQEKVTQLYIKANTGTVYFTLYGYRKDV